MSGRDTVAKRADFSSGAAVNLIRNVDNFSFLEVITLAKRMSTSASAFDTISERFSAPIRSSSAFS